MRREGDTERLRDAAGDVVLDLEHILHFAVIPVGPNAVTSTGFDELDSDAQAVAGTAHAASKHIGSVQLLSYLRACRRLVAIRQHRCPRKYLKGLDLSQFSNYIFRHAVAKIFILLAPLRFSK